MVAPNGVVIKWNPQLPVNYIIDNGPLGGLTRNEGASLVHEAFLKWARVPSATIRFRSLGFLSEDLTVANYKSFFNGEMRPENPLIFDSDGEIIDDIFGENSSDYIYGFAAPRFVDPETNEFISVWAVLNGKLADRSRETFKQVLIHEIGHMIGLDHTQAGRAFAQNFELIDNKFVPLMYPVVQELGPGRPIQDDIVWVSWLYPEPDFSTSTGTLKGRILRRSGGPFPGANVVAVPVTLSPPGTITELETIVSVVSGFLLTEDGSYEIPGLTSGD